MKQRVLAAACSALVPGAGQLVNRQPDRAIGVLLIAAISGASVLGAIPLLGPAATAVFGFIYVYAIVDAFRGATSRVCPRVRAVSVHGGSGHH